LRERPEDIPLLAQAFLREFAKENDKTVNDFTPDAIEAMMQYEWPGNVRELRTAIEHGVVLCRAERIGVRDLPAAVRGGSAAGAGAFAPRTGAPGLDVTEAEKQLVIRALKECEGNRTEAARRLGLSRRTLHRKIHEYHLEGL
jgi:DNA-binding NtrC family response regulator